MLNVDSESRASYLPRFPRVPGRLRPFLGPLVALAAIGAVEAAAWTPFRIPNAPAVVLLAVVFSAFVSGLRPGLFTAGAAWAYFAYFFSIHGQSGHLFAYSVDDFRRVVIWGPTTPAMALMVGALHRRAARLASIRLEESEERARRVLDGALDAVVTMGADGRVTGWNARAKTVFGWSAEEAVGRPVAELIVPPRHREQHRAGLERFLATGEGRLLNRSLETTGLRKDGSEFPVELAITPLLQEGQPPEFAGFLRDITRRKQMEEVLVRSEKLAAVGRLSAQVAHEINNPLTVIAGYMDRLRAGAADDSRMSEAVERVGRAAARVQGLTRDLLDLARAGRMEMAPVSLAKVLEERRAQMEADFEKSRVRVEWRVPADLPPVQGSEEHLHQVFTNLFLNARQAMAAGGTLSVAAEAADGEVRVAVADTGVGIPPENRTRLFEPFFTTKPKGEGTGLGLAIVQSAVSRHGGRIEVRSEVGKGSTFTVVLPAGRDEARWEGGPVVLPAGGNGGAAQ